MEIQVLKVDEFLKLPELVYKSADKISQTLNYFSHCYISDENKQIIHEELSRLTSLMLLMLDYKIKIPSLKKYKKISCDDTQPLVIKTYYEVFNLFLEEDLQSFYEEFRSY